MRKIPYQLTAALAALCIALAWAIPASASQLPIITVWYEDALRFGQTGNPQTMINILGNVSDPDGSVTSLTYQLNGGPAVSLALGPNSTRLNNPGDFNVSIPISSLQNGNNALQLTARDNAGDVQTKTVTFSYTAGKTWPLPYTTNWAGGGSLNDQAQVVDGLWQITGNGIRTSTFGYDRLVALGDVNWSTYEVLVPITIHRFYPASGDPGGVGVITRWQGHTGTGQPPDDWFRIGSYAYYSNRSGSLALRLNQNDPITQDFSLSLNRTYIFKVRVESAPQGGRYSFKVWEQGQSEPAWSDPRFNRLVNVVDADNDMAQGSVLLVAHRADATFGNVTVCPLNAAYSLSLQRNGNGSITAQPAKSSYACGENVTLTAQPDPGWSFAGWSSDIPGVGSSQTISLTVTRPGTITANFQQGQPVVQGVKIYLPQITR